MQKRIISFFCVFLCALGAVCLRVVYLEDGGAAAGAAVVQSSRTLSVAQSRAGIFDRDGLPLVNQTAQWKALVFPEEADLNILKNYVEDENFVETAKSGLPVVVDTGGKLIDGAGVYNFKTPRRYAQNQLAAHIIGYVSDGSGTSGIEKAYDELLKSAGPQSTVTYYTDGRGRLLSGEEIRFSADDADKKSGVILTLDAQIQQAGNQC